MTRWLLAPTLLALSVSAAAQDAPDPQGSLVQVAPGAKRYFYSGGEKRGCPAPAVACRRKAFVLPGDLLVATESKGGFTQVTYVAPGHSDPTKGWIETAGLSARATPVPRPQSWIGSWSSWDETIQIAAGKRRGTLKVSGSALWGGRDPERVARGGVHIGEIDGEVPAPRSDRLNYTDDETDADSCHVAMRLLGPYLLVEDNNRCGGANVSFAGVYRR
jgi:hypothetical protein